MRERGCLHYWLKVLLGTAFITLISSLLSVWSRDTNPVVMGLIIGCVSSPVVMLFAAVAGNPNFHHECSAICEKGIWYATIDERRSANPKTRQVLFDSAEGLYSKRHIFRKSIFTEQVWELQWHSSVGDIKLTLLSQHAGIDYSAKTRHLKRFIDAAEAAWVQYSLPRLKNKSEQDGFATFRLAEVGKITVSPKGIEITRNGESQMILKPCFRGISLFNGAFEIFSAREPATGFDERRVFLFSDVSNAFALIEAINWFAIADIKVDKLHFKSN